MVEDKKIFLLLGGNILNKGILCKFKQMGYVVYVIDWNANPPLKGDKHYQIDVKDADSIIAALINDGVLEKVKFAYSSIDLAVKSVAKINSMAGLYTISSESLKYAGSKGEMTKKWKEDKLLNRLSNYYKYYTNEILEINKEMSIIIKPNASASSRGITILERNSSENDIIKAYNRAKSESADKSVVVEEYVKGTEFTVDMLGDIYGNVSVYGVSVKSHTANTNKNKIAVKLHYNAIDNDVQRRIAEYGIMCYKSLGFSASAGHLEVILKENGEITPLEIGARSSGFIASDLVDIVSGGNYLEDLISVQEGSNIINGFKAQKNKSSVYFFYDFPLNFEIKRECSLVDFLDESISSRYNDRSYIQKGNKFNLINSDNERYGFEILEGPKDKLTVEILKECERKMLNYMQGED